MREIIFDTETTGFDPEKGDRMVEIGCIELINRTPTGSVFQAYFNPQRAMPEGAQAVHGLSDHFLADKPLFADRAAELIAFLADSPLVAHNASFDFKFLNAELARCELAPIGTDRMIDTLAMAKRLHPGAQHSLDALCSRYGIDRSHRLKHGALLDAELLAQLYIELTGGRQIGLGLADASEAQTAPTPPRVDQLTIAARPAIIPRRFAASEAELARHQQFIADIPDALWTR